MKGDQRGAPASAVVSGDFERCNLGQSAENGVNRSPEVTYPFAVNDAQVENPLFSAFLDIIRDEVFYFPGGKCVEIENAVDRNFNGRRFRQFFEKPICSKMFPDVFFGGMI